MKHNIKLIAIDLDGTLLNSHHDISPRTAQAVRQAIAQGVQVIIATGRPRHTAEAFVQKLGLTTPGVFLQGLTIYDGDGTLRHETRMEPETARRVLAFAEACDYSVMVYNSRGQILTRSRNAHTDQMMKYGEQMPEVVRSITELPDVMPISKILIVDSPERVQIIQQQLRDVIGTDAEVFTSQPHLLEALPPGTSKGAGLAWLLRDLNIDPAEVMAIGDGDNDIEMLALVGVGVAMANGTPQARAAAKYIVADNNADGVAEAIERFVLDNDQ